MRVNAADVSARLNRRLDCGRAGNDLCESKNKNRWTYSLGSLPLIDGACNQTFHHRHTHQSNPLILALGPLLGEGLYGCWALEDPSWPLLWPLTLLLIPKQKLELMWTNTVWPRTIEQGNRGGRGLSSTVPKNCLIRWHHSQVWLFNSLCDSEGSLQQSLAIAAAARTTTTTASSRLKSGRQSRQEGEREEEGGGVSRGGAARTAGLARDWRSLRRLTDVPPGPLKGLLTHFDYSGPLVTQNITSSGTMNPPRRLSSLQSSTSLFPSSLRQATHCIVWHLGEVCV